MLVVCFWNCFKNRTANPVCQKIASTWEFLSPRSSLYRWERQQQVHIKVWSIPNLFPLPSTYCKIGYQWIASLGIVIKRSTGYWWLQYCYSLELDRDWHLDAIARSWAEPALLESTRFLGSNPWWWYDFCLFLRVLALHRFPSFWVCKR